MVVQVDALSREYRGVHGRRFDRVRVTDVREDRSVMIAIPGDVEQLDVVRLDRGHQLPHEAVITAFAEVRDRFQDRDHDR